MVKAKVQQPNGRTLLVLGLSHADLDKVRDGKGKYIHVDGKETGDLPIDITIWAEETDADLEHTLTSQITAETKVNIDPALRNPVQTRQ